MKVSEKVNMPSPIDGAWRHGMFDHDRHMATKACLVRRECCMRQDVFSSKPSYMFSSLLLTSVDLVVISVGVGSRGKTTADAATSRQTLV
jgi:hypothetical protein